MNVRQSRLIYAPLIKSPYCMLLDRWKCNGANVGIHNSLCVLGFSHFLVQNFTLLVDAGKICSLEHYMHAEGFEVHTSHICHLLTFFKSVRNPM